MILIQRIVVLLLCGIAVIGCKSGKKQQDIEKITTTINGYEYHYDVVTGATVENKEKTTPMDYEEKLKQMFWSPKPSVGFVKGDYYHAEATFDEGHLASVDIVKDGDKIVFAELDEIVSPTYYAKDFAGSSKRYSGYAFLQAKSQRTDKTLVTLVNSLTYLEHQIVQENRLAGEFKTVRGSSNSINRGFLPTIATLTEQVAKPSGQYYYSLTKDMGDGITARLLVVTENGKIIKAKYDEFFGDTQEAISSPDMKQFYRQSKYHSITYPQLTNVDFKAFADSLASSIIESQDMLNPIVAMPADGSLDKEMQNYKQLAAELKEKMQ